MNRGPKTLLVLALVGVVGMAFRVSWNALRDVARAIGADGTAATLYPFVVDGLMALALIATLVLTDPKSKSFALKVLAGYTIASLVLNYVHGLVPALHDPTAGRVRLADMDAANWLLVLLATSLPVGSIYFGSDLVAKVLHHRPALDQSVSQQANESASQQAARSMPDQEETQATAPIESAPESAPAVEAPVPTVTPTEVPADTPTERQQYVLDSFSEQMVPVEKKSTGARPRKSTGKVPTAAKSTPPRRSLDELLDEARTLTLPDDELSAEKIRTSLRVGAAKARQIRDLLQAERDELADRYSDEATDTTTDRRHGLHLVTDDETADTTDDAKTDGDQPTGTDH
jgi:hypothetical protein